MSEHTPGPWRYSEDVSRHGTRLVYGNDGHLVCDAGRIPKRTAHEAEANARLIAAAPELLDALRRLSAMADYMQQQGAMREPTYSADCPYEPTTEGQILMNARAVIAKATSTPEHAHT